MWVDCVCTFVCVSIATPGPGCGKHPQQQYQEERSGVSMLSRAEQWMARRHSRCLQQMYKDPLDTLQTSSTHCSSSLIRLCCIFHVFYHLPLYKPFSFSSHAPSPTHLPPFVFFFPPSLPNLSCHPYPVFPLFSSSQGWTSSRSQSCVLRSRSSRKHSRSRTARTRTWVERPVCFSSAHFCYYITQHNQADRILAAYTQCATDFIFLMSFTLKKWNIRCEIKF